MRCKQSSWVENDNSWTRRLSWSPFVKKNFNICPSVEDPQQRVHNGHLCMSALTTIIFIQYRCIKLQSMIITYDCNCQKIFFVKRLFLVLLSCFLSCDKKSLDLPILDGFYPKVLKSQYNFRPPVLWGRNFKPVYD